MSTATGIAADLLVAALLVATIISSLRLSRRMSGLKADEAAMRATVAELVTATENAERAIGGLRMSLAECDRTLLDRLEGAERASRHLSQSLGAGDALVTRLEQTIEATRRAFQVRVGQGLGAAEARPSRKDLSAVLASAQALAERSASRARAKEA